MRTLLRYVLSPGFVLLFFSHFASATVRDVQVCVQDARGLAITGAQVQVQGDAALNAFTDQSGCVTVTAAAQALLHILHPGFGSISRPLGNQVHIEVVMQVAAASQQIEVTASRTPLALDATASSVRTITAQQLREAPGYTLDDKLRQVAGFQLFRRTSSWVANPTTEGTTLRGLGSTSASRTLVLTDQVPLNDAYGGWIHWNEIPALAIRDVELVRGGASDLYGSSAIGGVIDVIPVVPQQFSYGLDLAGGTENTSILNGLLTGAKQGWSGLAASSLFHTDGYILTAPELRGPIDVNANDHSQSGRLEIRHALGTDGGVFLRGNVLNDARDNGTLVQRNWTRLWRYAGGADWTVANDNRLLLRLFGTDQTFRQTFSAINTPRTVEKLTAFHIDPAQQLGGAVQWARTYRNLTLVAGSDVLDTRGADLNLPSAVSISARQRGEGVYGEVLWQPETWSIAFSSRYDHFGSFDARQSGGTPPPLPAIRENVFDPRLGIVKRLNGVVSLTGSVFRAFRGPNQDELYRQSQVGQQITLPNASLRSERATGFEFGSLVTAGRLGSVRGSYFFTQVNRPVAAVTLSSTPTSTLLQRQNLGQLTSKGFAAEWELHPASFMTLIGGYQLAISTVTRFQADPALVGNWTPQVPRNLATLQMRFERSRLGAIAVDLRTSGQQFEDQSNQYRLAGYAQVDLYAEHNLGEHWQLYASTQNLLNQPVEAGRTPLLTLGSPRTVSGGIRLH